MWPFRVFFCFYPHTIYRHMSMSQIHYVLPSTLYSPCFDCGTLPFMMVQCVSVCHSVVTYSPHFYPDGTLPLWLSITDAYSPHFDHDTFPLLAPLTQPFVAQFCFLSCNVDMTTHCTGNNCLPDIKHKAPNQTGPCPTPLITPLVQSA